MRNRVILVAALAVVLLAWLSFRPASPKPSTVMDIPPASPASPARIPELAPSPLRVTAERSVATLSPAEKPPPTNFMAQAIKGELPELTLAQLSHYLETSGRNADSLLTAYQATHERALLDEAMAKYPNDPRVAFTAWFRAPADVNDADALKARRQALDQFKQAAPDNALANYLSAANYFRSGQPELAVQEMQAGAGKPRYNDYVQEAIQDMTEAYQAAGYSDAESKVAAGSGALLPHLTELKQDGLKLVELANTYQQAGDTASAQAAMQMSLDLGQRLDDPNSLTLIQTLVGIAIQRKALDAMVATAPDADAAQAVQAQINALIQQREGIKATASVEHLDTWLQNAPAQDISNYFDRRRLFGEQQAMQWLANRNGK